MKQTGEVVTELVIGLPNGGQITVRVNAYPVIEHPIICCVLLVNALWGQLVERCPPVTLTVTLTTTLTLSLPITL